MNSREKLTMIELLDSQEYYLLQVKQAMVVVSIEQTKANVSLVRRSKCFLLLYVLLL